MALVSPGVEVNIVDQSQYLPAASSSVPLLLIATAQSKANAAGTAVAAATTKANANKLYQVTSQRDLVNLYGNPFFYKTTNGTPIHGYELNEYGLLAAYSLLGTTNRCYILRADVDLAGFVGTLSRPTGEATDGQYWLDTTNTSWGIHEFNATTGVFTKMTPIVIMDAAELSGGKPKFTVGNVGDYAVFTSPAAGVDLLQETATYFYKTKNNEWQVLGSPEWRKTIPMVSGTESNPILVAGHSFDITVYGSADIPGYNYITPTAYTIEVGANGTDVSVDGLATVINNAGFGDLYAEVVSGKLVIYSQASIDTTLKVDFKVEIVANSGTVLDALGIAEKTYYAPTVTFGTSAQMPLWTSSQTAPHPTGSVWIKTSAAGNGVNIVLAKYKTSTAAWGNVDVPMYPSLFDAIYDLDSTGGKAIPAGTVVAEYPSNAGTSQPAIPVRIWERLVAGEMVFTGTQIEQTITSGNLVTVYVTIPGYAQSNVVYQFTNTGTTFDSFINDWQLANIPYTMIEKTTDGLLQLTHTEGGEILIHDLDSSGMSSGLLTSLFGDIMESVNGKQSQLVNLNIAKNIVPDDTDNAGTGGNFSVDSTGSIYCLSAINDVNDPMAGYAVGDTITFYGSQLGGVNGENDLVLTVTGVAAGKVTSAVYKSGTAAPKYWTTLSNWVNLDYISNDGKPVASPANGTTWYYSTPSVVDIMVNQGGVWKGYRNVPFDNQGHPQVSGSNTTDPAGPICAAEAPTTQSDGTALEYGDLWIDTADLENYPVIYRWENVSDIDQWILIDKTDQVSSKGVIFADARWASSGAIDPIDDYVPTIASLLTSNHLDLDAPDPSLYPQGMLLWNTRRSGYNVKEFKTNYFTQSAYPEAGAYDSGSPANNNNLPNYTYAWVSASGLKADGSAYMGRKAQRAMIVEALKSAIATNVTIREEDNFFNLISCPGYPELQPDMVTLNNDRHNTAYIVGDTPLRLPDQATDITNWATNAAGATATGEDGWVTRDSYLGVFYPSGITTDLTGSPAVVPASHMILRTMLRNDTIGYPWFAPAGTRRGTIDNATNIGYLDDMTGEFQTVKNRMSIRDVLYTNQINPLAYFTGVGLLNYGNKNSFDSQSALDRINVARLVAYIRQQLMVAARPFVFEPNDALTRSQLSGVIQSLFIDLVAKRGLYDYLVVCDTTNNTPARIDRNELWVDIAVEPVKAAEFIYIPVRLLNTGELGGTA
jgi:hypothetical protein